MITDDHITLAFMGDVRIPAPPASGVFDPFLAVTPWLQDADVVIANLEGPIGATNSPRPNRGALLFNDPSVLDLCKPWKETVFVLANNHIMDYGPEGLGQTLSLLKERGIACVGAGPAEVDACRPLVLRIRGQTIGILAYTTEERHVGSICAKGAKPGCADLLAHPALEAVRDLARTVDTVCVILHWGHEFHAYPTPAQVARVHDLVEAGAAVVVGHHPHVLQGLHQIGPALVAYSLGNCVFPPFEQTNGRMSVQSPEEREYFLLKVRLDRGKLSGWDITAGARDSRNRLRPFPPEKQEPFRASLQKLAEPLGRPGYQDFHAAYRKARELQLERQQLWKAFRKIRLRNLMSVRPVDFHRLWKRITARSRR